ncbi:MAG: DegT/DnrJ/EryC1/StrS family aminotransferase [Prevotella sp.]|nr:DegT/DnrJ/EryC1/StrS family aminotransferase [Candidatus Prevotella equi]
MTKKMNIPFSPPDITVEEADAVRDALLSGWITTGPRVKEFERRIAAFCSQEEYKEDVLPHVVCLSSATASMEMAYRLIGIKPSDEVIIPAYTYTATASSVLHAGGKLVMCDSQPGTFEMDYEQLARLITPRTKVIVAVDIAGVICDYDRIYEIVNRPETKAMFHAESDIQKEYGRVIVLADCAHSFGSSKDGKMAGTWADFNAFSFHAVKNFTTAEGGALAWRSLGEERDALLYRKLQLLSLHGQSKDAFAKTKLGAWEYDVVGAYYKANMTDIMAAIGLVQMRRYPEMLARREQIINYYNCRLKEFVDNGTIQVLRHFFDSHHSNGHLYQVRMIGKGEAERNAVITRMAELGVATNVHFKPLPMMTAYSELGFDISNFPAAYDYYKNEITLPLWSKMTDKQAEYVMDCFVEVLRQNK